MTVSTQWSDERDTAFGNNFDAVSDILTVVSFFIRCIFDVNSIHAHVVPRYSLLRFGYRYSVP